VEADGKTHDSAELPDPKRLVGKTVQAVLFVARLTNPLKPWRAVTVTVEFDVAPAFTSILVGLAVRVKS